MNHPNPVIPGFHPDPSVCRVGDEYFLATSSFAYLPGSPIFRSTDLADWTLIGHALDRPSQIDLSATDGSVSLGMYAPTLRHHDGRFWLVTTNVTRTGSTSFLVTADDPAGPWSDPVPIPVDGFDPDIAWDAEGRCIVHVSTMFDIVGHHVDEQTGQVLRSWPAWSGTGLWCPEAPHLFERADTWYLVIAEGGTERGHCVSIARGPSPEGPWEACPSNPILSHRSTASPIRNTGHADLVEAPDGSWSMVLLGVRTKGVSPGFHVLGRETFLVGVEWVDGWPVPDALVPGPSEIAHAVRDEFDDALGSEWVSLRQVPESCTTVGGRRLRVHAGGLVLRRQQHPFVRVRARLTGWSAAEAGLTLFLDEDHRFDLYRAGDRVTARARVDGLGANADSVVDDDPVVLVVETRPHPHGPDAVVLGFEDPSGAFVELVELDGRYLSTEVAGGFTGRMVGMFAVDGDAEFDWFEYEPVAG